MNGCDKRRPLADRGLGKSGRPGASRDKYSPRPGFFAIAPPRTAPLYRSSGFPLTPPVPFSYIQLPRRLGTPFACLSVPGSVSCGSLPAGAKGAILGPDAPVRHQARTKEEKQCA